MTEEAVFIRKAREANLEAGDKIYFHCQKSPMTVKARNERYIILTEPNYKAKAVYYSIVDLESQWKAPNNLVLNIYDYTLQEDVDKCLQDLITGKTGLSQRRGMPVDFNWERTEARKARLTKKKGKVCTQI